MLTKLFILFFILLISLPAAFAAPLANGGVLSPVLVDNVWFIGTQVADTGTLFLTISPFTSGTLDQKVFQESSGTLDFYYIVTNNLASTRSIGRVTTNNFTGYSTGVSYVVFPIGGFPPTEADRNLAGDTIGFNFQGVNGNILFPGASSYSLEISTNATAFALTGTTSVSDGIGQGTVTTYSPVPITPEPVSLTLVTTGLAGLVIASALRRKAS